MTLYHSIEIPFSLDLLSCLRGFEHENHNFTHKFLDKVNQSLQALSNKGQNDSNAQDLNLEKTCLALHYYLSLVDNIEKFLDIFYTDFNIEKLDVKLINKTNIFNVHSILRAVEGFRKTGSQIKSTEETNNDANDEKLGNSVPGDHFKNQRSLRFALTDKESHFKEDCFYISSEMLELTLNSRGRFDLDFVCILCNELNKEFNIELRHYLLQSTDHNDITSDLSNTAQAILNTCKEITYNEDNFKNHMKTFTVEKDLNSLLNIITELEHIIYYVLLSLDQKSRDLLKRLFICLLGHEESQIREKAIIYLNILIDGIEWQLKGGYKTVVSTVGSEHFVSYVLESESDYGSQNVIYLLYSFPFDNTDEPPLLSWHQPEISTLSDDPAHILATVELGAFPRAGFYDWKFVRLHKGGKMNSIYAGFKVDMDEELGIIQEISSDDISEPRSSVSNFHRSKVIQGRFIVHPKHTKELEIHEIYADFPEGIPGEENRGSFMKITDNIPQYVKAGINCLYILGALERDYGGILDKSTGKKKDFSRKDPSPIAVTCRKSVSSVLGGVEDFKGLIGAAKEKNIEILVDCVTRVSSSRYNRRYRDLLLQFADEDGKLTLAYGGEGRARKYEETVYLNYRKKEAWDLLYEETLYLIREYGIGGLHLDDVQTWPQMFSINEEELIREDTDGDPAYNLEERFYGNVIIRNKPTGYWHSEAKNSYANPMLVEFCQKIWQEFPHLLLIGEVWGGQGHDNNENNIIRSGIIPRLYKIAPALATVYGKRINGSGGMYDAETFSINTVRRWYEEKLKSYPAGAIVIQSTTSPSLPYPALLFKRGTWSFVDLMFFLPHIPMTFMGEMLGHAFRCSSVRRFQTQQEKLTNDDSPAKTGRSVYVKAVLDGVDKGFMPGDLQVESSLSCRDNSQDFINSQEGFCKEVGPEYGFDLNKIYLHYDHRRQLRKNLEPLKKEKMIALIAEHAEGYHSHVLAFARVYKMEMVIIATNFNSFTVYFGINMKGLKYLFDEFDKETLEYCVIKITDHLGKAFDDHYTIYEFLNGQIDTFLYPSASLIWGVTIITGDKDLHNKTLVRSLERIKTKIARGQLLGGNEVVTMLVNTVKESVSVQEFANNLGYIYRHFLKPAGISIPQMLNSIKELQEDSALCAKLFAFCTLLSDQAPKNFEGVSPLIRKPGRGKLSFDESMTELMTVRSNSNPTFAPRKTSDYSLTTTPVKGPLEIAAESTLNEMSTIFDFVHDIINYNTLSSIAFITPELGRWSTVGGLGVMVDELSVGLAELGEDIICVSPYYERNRKGESGYLERDPDNIIHVFNMEVSLGDGSYVVGVHHGVVKGVRLYFLSNSFIFPHPYAEAEAKFTMQQLALMAKASLELFCMLDKIPSLIVTNDWFTALVPAYPKNGHFGDFFKNTKFFHIVHNLDQTYEGRLYPNPHEGYFEHIHNLPYNLFVDPYWTERVLNPSRCAIMSCDQWGTVSFSYKHELLEKSPLSHLLRNHSQPFAFPNGIPKNARFNKILQLCNNDHFKAKEILQKKYFKMEKGDTSIPIFGFVGRITQQKGVHLILENAGSLISKHSGKIQFLIGGMVNTKDPYGSYCAGMMYDLLCKYPSSFWASPGEFFTDGALVNIGADFGLMPSLFEPGGIVQHEFFIGSTPVIAFETGGLKDTVFEFDSNLEKGNGFIFKTHDGPNFVAAIERALGLYNNQEKYTILRKNAFNSTIDVEDVSRAWNKEFHRLFNKSFIDPVLMKIHKEKIDKTFSEKDYQEKFTLNKVALEFDGNKKKRADKLRQQFRKASENLKSCVFVYKTTKLPKPKDVMIIGTFDNWREPVPMNYDHILERWTVTLLLKPGEYLYKFVVDNRWVCTDDDPKLTDLQGNLNNYVQVV